jgi:hypothetical protein
VAIYISSSGSSPVITKRLQHHVNRSGKAAEPSRSASNDSKLQKLSLDLSIGSLRFRMLWVQFYIHLRRGDKVDFKFNSAVAQSWMLALNNEQLAQI